MDKKVQFQWHLLTSVVLLNIRVKAENCIECFYFSDVRCIKKNCSTLALPHKLVYTDYKRRRKCAYCEMKKVKTYSGNDVYSYFMCRACDVVLCQSMRNCFVEYHKYIAEKIDKSQG